VTRDDVLTANGLRGPRQVIDVMAVLVVPAVDHLVPPFLLAQASPGAGPARHCRVQPPGRIALIRWVPIKH
jgi:hypothetical protein